MEDLIVAPIVLLVGFGIHFIAVRNFTAVEGRLLNRSFLAHVFSGFAQIFVYVYYYGSGDMTAYRDFGIPIADALRYDFNGIFPGTVQLLIQSKDMNLPFESPLGGGSTGSMLMLSAYLLFLLGNSFYGVTLAIAMLAYISKVVIYRALHPEFPPEQKRAVMIAVMLMPTAVFWSCGLLKEPIVMIFMGPLFLGFRYIIDGGRPLRAWLLVAVGAFGVVLFKAYVLLSFGVAASVWLIWARVIRDRGSMAVKPLYLVIGALVGMVLITVADRYLLKRSEGGFAQSMAAQRRAAGMVEGDSNFSLEGDTVSLNAETSLSGELLLAPFALLTALFRPFIFEVRKPMQFLNALETTWVLWASLQIFRRRHVAGVVSRITASPVMMFCVVFTLILALGTGLSTSNLGALSRYRAPMMPFFALLLLTLAPPPKQSLLDAKLQLAPTTT